MIRKARAGDVEEICGIYNPYVLDSTITFEEEAVSVAEMAARLEEVQSGLVWLVLEEEGRIQGYAYAGKWKGRSAYRHSVETSIYLRRGAEGRGLGKALYTALLGELRALGVHAVIGGVAQPNERSRALHEGLGFRKVAHFTEVGRKFGRWLDVAYWELIL